MLEVGKLYSCSGYYLMLYPDKEAAAAAAEVRRWRRWRRSADAAAYWTKKLQKPVSYCDPKTPLLILNTDNHYAEVLAGDKKGWINYQDWMEFKEIIDEAA